MFIKQQLTDIVIQLTQLLNSITINTKIHADSIAVILSDDTTTEVTNCTIKVKDGKRQLDCLYFTEACDRHYEITVGIIKLIQLVEYNMESDDEWRECENNKYTTLYENNVWLVEPS